MKAIREAIMQVISTGESLASSGDYNCPYCGRFVPKKEFTLFGRKHIVQPVCECEGEAYLRERKRLEDEYKKDLIKQMFDITKLGHRFSESTFETFEVRDGTETAYKIARKYSERFDDYPSSLMLWGNPGSGKSHLAAAVANELMKRGKTVIFQSVPELLSRIRATYNDDAKETEAEVITALTQCDLLILDDLGSEKISEWVLDTLFRIVDGRYRSKKHTMVTTNLDPAELPQAMSVRIADRLIEMATPVRVSASSYRLEKAKERIKAMTDE